MKSYPIDESLGKLANFHPPFNRFVSTMGKILMHNIPFYLKRAQVNYRRIRLKGRYPFNIYVVYPNAEKDQPHACYLYLHGGGFAYKANGSQIAQFLTIIKELNIVGILIDYSVLKPYPIPNQQIAKAFDYLYENADSLHIDKEHIAVGGDSAGGYLAADLTRLRSDQIKAMVLCFPVLDPSLSTESMKSFLDTPLWNGKNNKKMWAMYGQGNPEVPNFLELEDYSCFPPAYIEVCEFDCLKDEAIAFKDKFVRAGCSVTYRFIEGAMHGYDTMKSSPLTKKSIEERIGFLRRYLER